jgi:hypothetical protein
VAFFEDAEIPTGSTSFLDTKSKILYPPAPRQFPTGLSGLRDLDQGVTDFKNITDTHVTFQQAFNCKVFTEASWLKISQAYRLCPIGVVFSRVNIDGFLWSTMIFKVRLPVPVKIQAAKPK